jgi:hypothetical protein
LDHAERYFQLSLLGRDAFRSSVAPAALIRLAASPLQASRRHGSYDESDTLVAALDQAGITGDGPARGIEVYPLAKKPGAPFADMITVGRTANNDVVVNDITVSRFHAFFRQRGAVWSVCDAGSKNGTSLDGTVLEARKERPIQSGQQLRVGDIELVFHNADDLFDILSGSVRPLSS